MSGLRALASFDHSKFRKMKMYGRVWGPDTAFVAHSNKHILQLGESEKTAGLNETRLKNMAYKGCLLCAIFCHWFQSVSCIYIMLICWFLTGVSGRHTVSNLCMWLVPSKEWLSKGKEDWESFESYHGNVLCSIVQIVRLTITFWSNQNLELNVHTEAASSMSQLLPRSWQEKLSPISPGYWVGRRSQCCHANIYTTFTFTQV